MDQLALESVDLNATPTVFSPANRKPITATRMTATEK
jgi:hypothetical protein